MNRSKEDVEEGEILSDIEVKDSNSDDEWEDDGDWEEVVSVPAVRSVKASKNCVPDPRVGVQIISHPPDLRNCLDKIRNNKDDGDKEFLKSIAEKVHKEPASDRRSVSSSPETFVETPSKKRLESMVVKVDKPNFKNQIIRFEPSSKVSMKSSITKETKEKSPLKQQQNSERHSSEKQSSTKPFRIEEESNWGFQDETLTMSPVLRNSPIKIITPPIIDLISSPVKIVSNTEVNVQIKSVLGTGEGDLMSFIYGHEQESPASPEPPKTTQDITEPLISGTVQGQISKTLQTAAPRELFPAISPIKEIPTTTVWPPLSTKRSSNLMAHVAPSFINMPKKPSPIKRIVSPKKPAAVVSKPTSKHKINPRDPRLKAAQKLKSTPSSPEPEISSSPMSPNQTSTYTPVISSFTANSPPLVNAPPFKSSISNGSFFTNTNLTPNIANNPYNGSPPVNYMQPYMPSNFPPTTTFMPHQNYPQPNFMNLVGQMNNYSTVMSHNPMFVNPNFTMPPLGNPSPGCYSNSSSSSKENYSSKRPRVDHPRGEMVYKQQMEQYNLMLHAKAPRKKRDRRESSSSDSDSSTSSSSSSSSTSSSSSSDSSAGSRKRRKSRKIRKPERTNHKITNSTPVIPNNFNVKFY